MELTLEQALQKGVEAHKAGKAQEADKYYTAILKANPKHPDANHNMGALAVGVGKVEAALPFFKTALEVNQTIGQYWLSYINALIKLDRMDEAKSVLNQAKSNGAKGDGFDQLDTRLGLSTSKNSNVQNPSQKELQSLVNLYTQGQHQQALTKASQLLKAFPNSIILHNILGAANTGLGKLEESIEVYNKALSIRPDYADTYYNMGNSLKAQGKLEEAIEAYNKTISIKPDFADGYFNMGIALKAQGKLEEAIEAYNKAFAIKPNYAEAYNNMGIALKDQGKLEEAIEAYNKAFAIKPNYAEAYNNMGNALKDQGKLEEAIEAYTKAISTRPDFAEAYNNIAVSLKDQGKLEEAIEAYTKAISLKPDFADAYHNMGNALKDVKFTKPNSDLQVIITTLLEQKTSTRPREVCAASISLLKFEPCIQNLIQEHAQGTLSQSFQETVLALSEIPLLLKLMSICPLADLELEEIFTNIRSSFLASILEFAEKSDTLRFQSALALQCFTNEYLYDQSDADTKGLQKLEDIVQKNFSNGKQPSPQVILCLASFKALNEYQWCDLLNVESAIEEVFTRQVMEPNQEARIKLNIPALQKITDKVSLKVRQQYEESPYPRWINSVLPLKPSVISTIVNKAKLKIFDNKIKEVNEPNILIAGCGTGQHSIGTASKFKDSKVLAVDLSLSSLAYAKRKTDELKITNIEYMQADILNLSELGKQFDIIESFGVLHHMADPIAGWRVLTKCLKKGGLMRIGLYSELARWAIVKVRKEIAESGIGSSNSAMKSFRKNMIKSEKNYHKEELNSPDFYSMSTLRDLLFHTQEHRFTITQIKDSLDDLGLKFCGFETRDIVREFMSINTEADDPYDLDKWQAFEESNPRTFVRIYDFWCQKVD